jgi:hypothetical protein
VTMLTSTTVVSVSGVAGAVNEDLALVGNSWVVVLDGAGRYPGVDQGCVHEVAWMVSRLGSHLRSALSAETEKPLPEVLASAIAETAAEHGPECDTEHPLALGAAAAIVRQRGDVVDWLVLGDVAVVIESRKLAIQAIIDDRVDRLTGAPITDAPVRTYEPAHVACWRNRTGGFWVASTQPDAAYESITGRCSVSDISRMLVCTDGVSRLVERYGSTWASVLSRFGQPDTILDLVPAVRQAELADPDPRRWRGRRHDDATAVLLVTTPL